MHSMTVLSAGKDYRSCAVAFPRDPPQSRPRLDLLNCWNPSADKRLDSESPDQTISETRRISETLSLRDHGHAVRRLERVS
jgi:hypothetical protein